MEAQKGGDKIMLRIAGIDFSGPYTDRTEWNTVPAVYVVLTGTMPIDVGETDNLMGRMANHERRGCWLQHSPAGLCFAALVVADQEERRRIENLIRRSHSLPCGER